MGYILSFILFIWGLFNCYIEGLDVATAGLFVSSALFYTGNRIGTFNEKMKRE